MNQPKATTARSRQYRKCIFVHGSLKTETQQPAFDLAAARTVADQQNGELSLPERLRCRIRYFTDGLIPGSQSFVESHFYALNGYWVSRLFMTLLILEPSTFAYLAVFSRNYAFPGSGYRAWIRTMNNASKGRCYRSVSI